MLKIVAHYLYRITSFLIIYFVMHHADIPFHLGYNSYKLLLTDSTLFFNTRLVWRKSHRDLFSVASNTCFFFTKYANQSAHSIKVSFKLILSFCKMPRTNDSSRQNMSVVEWKEKLSESVVEMCRFWNEVRNHLFTVSATVPSIAQL